MSTRLVFASVLVSLSIGSLAHAQTATPSPVTATTPRVVRLEGEFVPANGQPRAAAETMTLGVYASATDATPIFEETQAVYVDTRGRYVVYLGATVVDGLSADLFSGDQPRWLGVRFERPGEPDLPRTPLASVPYAVRAATADTLGGLPPSAFLRVGDARPAGEGPATEPAAGRDPATPPALTSGTANYLGKFTNSVDIGNSIVFESGSSIGINTTTPLDIIHSRFTNTNGTLTGLAVQNLGNTATSYSGMLFYDQNGQLGQFQGFNNSTHEYRINNVASGGTINFMLGGSSRFRIRSDADIEIAGNIRKGPGYFLHNAGVRNLGVGAAALSNTGTTDNVAVGADAMTGLSSGAGQNVAIGSQAMSANGSGQQNTALGYSAMRDGTGSFNISLGAFTATSKVSGDYNAYLGYAVGSGASNTESFTIRIGDSGVYTRHFVGAVRGVTTGQANAVAVVIDANGQLGTVNSSRRYKEDIQDMGDASSGLLRLRPVTYRYTQAYADGSRPLDYGLIAEEVAEVYPDLVTHLKGGEIETVQYHKVNAMLLNEVQKQHRQIEQQRREMAVLTGRLAALERLLTSSPQR